MNIDYQNISKSIEFYEKLGYQYIDVPWYVTEEIITMTKPNANIPDYQLSANGKFLIASGEQGFLYLIMKGTLPPGKYVTCTPCYRFEAQDWLHRKTFMKVELIDFITNMDENVNDGLLMMDASRFFHSLLPLQKLSPLTLVASDSGPLDVHEPSDWTLNGIEIGSYGVRQYKNLVKWAYGTGLAEPRFSVAKNFKTQP